MEELRTAISAMKKAEEALAKQGFILRWKYRIKAERSFARNAINRLMSDTSVPEKTPVIRATPKARTAREQKPREEPKSVPAQTISAPSPEAQSKETAEVAIEERPVTALDIKAAASYLGISYAGVFDLMKRGRLPAHGEIGKRWLLPEDLDNYLASRKKPV